MAPVHDHRPVRRPTAAAPTLSLLRLSAGARLAGAGLVSALLWALVAATLA